MSEQHTSLFPSVLGRVRGASPPLRQKVDMRAADSPAADAYADQEQREAYLARREAARTAQSTRYAVSLGCQVQLRDGTWLQELAPVDPSQFDVGALRELVRSGHVVERYDLQFAARSSREPTPTEAA